MIKAGSLLYAVYVCLLISIFSATLLFIFTVSIEFSARQSIKERLIDRCESCLNFYLSDSNNFNDLKPEMIDIFGDGLVCEFIKTRWGAYTSLNVKAFFKSDTVQKIGLVGESNTENKLALYISDLGEELKLSGATSIKGNMQLPREGHKTVNILGNNQLNKPVVNGHISISEHTLPKLAFGRAIFLDGEKWISFSQVKNQSTIFRSFKKETLIINLENGERIEDINIKGNIIIKSNDTLYIERTAKIEDVIVNAPKVVINDGFHGNMQIFADKEIVLGERVKLDYPSSLVIYPDKDGFDKKITISTRSEVYGGVLIEGESFDEKENNKIRVDEGALIIGDLYCNGKLQLQGKVIGSVYAHKLEMETESGDYGNLLLNASIEADNLPNDFIRLPLFAQDKKLMYGMVKYLW